MPSRSPASTWRCCCCCCALILRPVGFKFRSKLEGTRWRTAWDWALFVGGLVPALVFGVAFGNVLQGVPFRFDDTLRMTYTGTLFGLFNPFALLCGLVSVAMIAMHGAAWLACKTEGAVRERARSAGMVAALVLVVLFVAGRHLGGAAGWLRRAVVRRRRCAIQSADQAGGRARSGALMGNYARDALDDAGAGAGDRRRAARGAAASRARGCAGLAFVAAGWRSPGSSRPPASACSRSCCRRRSIRRRA